jgi:hypothetical protein
VPPQSWVVGGARGGGAVDAEEGRVGGGGCCARKKQPSVGMEEEVVRGKKGHAMDRMCDRSRDRMTHFWVMSRSPKHNFDQMHVFPKSIYDLLIFRLNTLEVIDIQNFKKYYWNPDQNFMYFHIVSKKDLFRAITRSSRYNFDHYFLLKYMYKN